MCIYLVFVSIIEKIVREIKSPPVMTFLERIIQRYMPKGTVELQEKWYISQC